MRGLLIAVLVAGCGAEPVAAGVGGAGGYGGQGGVGGQGGGAPECEFDIDCAAPGEPNCSVCNGGKCQPGCASDEECRPRLGACTPGPAWIPGRPDEPAGPSCDPTGDYCCADLQGVCCAADGCRALVCYYALADECSSHLDCPADRPICAYQGSSCSYVCSDTTRPG